MHTESVADSIEVELLIGEHNAHSTAWIRSESFIARSVKSHQLDGAIAVMKRRADLLGALYPFEVRNVGVVRRPSADEFPYSALLLVTPGTPLLEWDASRISQSAELFEHIVVPAAKAMLGEGSCSVRFAFPSGGRPVEFPRAILWLADQMGLKPGNAYRPPRRKDGGVDIVAWRPFADGRPGFPVALVQATIEQRFVHKAGDIDLRVWAGWLRLDVDPMSVLAIPRTVPNDESWNEASTRAVVLERIRLAGLLPSAFEPELRTLVSALVTEQLAEVRRKVET